jgi:DNA-binding Lrp family transcriptional regulator
MTEMPPELDDLDCRIIACLCGDIGTSLHPFAEIAAELGITEDELLARLQSYRQRGLLRRFGAILRHRRAGYNANGMCVWNVPDGRVHHVGRQVAGFDEVSHCYRRPRLPDWPYNLYAMIHGHTEDECRQTAARIAGHIELDDYRILFSVCEFKKTSMAYFADPASPQPDH